ncbi:MAG: MBL fold metallo-hydrolase [Dehalococcoidia bacterium]|nr:MBL fold metallo-hydrolase [Dehalococcoidia bacterium]
MEIIPGIHQINIPLPNNALQRINAYLVRGHDGWTLVDCGWNTPEAFEAHKAALDELKIGFRDIRHIIVTHFHPDHFGLVGRLKELCGCTFTMHAIEAGLIESRYINIESLLDDIAIFLMQNGVPREEAEILKNASVPVLGFVTPAFPDTLVHGGETINTGEFNFQVLWTPGHSPGHICLYEKEHKLFIAGDHILPSLTPNISLHAQQRGNPLADFLDSLRALDKLEVDIVLPGHDDVFQGFHKRIGELIVHHDRRNVEILGIGRSTPKTAYEMAPMISWVNAKRSWQDLPPLDRRLAVLETLSHLEFLYSLGKIEKFQQDGQTYFLNPRN